MTLGLRRFFDENPEQKNAFSALIYPQSTRDIGPHCPGLKQSVAKWFRVRFSELARVRLQLVTLMN